MKKEYYFWIFALISLVLCGSLLIAIFKLDNTKEDNIRQTGALEINDSGSKKNEKLVVEETDLIQEDIDFEEDVADLADDFIDDSIFDESINLDSLENEIN